MTSPAFQFYPADFLTDENVVVMTNEEIGCYMKLLCYCWREGTIPAEVAKLARLCGVDSTAMALLWPAIQKCFEQDRDQPDRLVHPRLEEEREKQEKFRAKKAEAGRDGAKSRWANKKRIMAQPSVCHKQENGTAIGLPMAKDSSSSLSSSSSLLGTYKGKGQPSYAIPASEAEAVEWCVAAGVPPDFAKDLYNQCEGRGWVDGAGQDIRSWSHYAKRRYTQSNIIKAAPASKPDHRADKAAKEHEQPPMKIKKL